MPVSVGGDVLDAPWELVQARYKRRPMVSPTTNIQSGMLPPTTKNGHKVRFILEKRTVFVL